MATVTAPVAQRLVLYAVDWQLYSRLLRAFGDRPLRLTYDRGVLEIMSPLAEHESDAYLLGRFVDTLTDELDLEVKAGRTVTLRRRRKQRGLEPDNCYWIAHEAQVRGKPRIDLRIDPPPDLAIEVDKTSSSLNRMSIYANLGFLEVWRLDDRGLSFHLLGANGRYKESSHSLAFPRLTPADLTQFLVRSGQVGETALVRLFRAWVRQHLLTPPHPPAP